MLGDRKKNSDSHISPRSIGDDWIQFLVLRIDDLFKVKKVRVEKRVNEIVNRLNKTKVERKVDLQALREERDKKERDARKADVRKQQEKEKELEKKRKEESELRFAKNA